jgi:hypothetical protein
LKSLIPIAVTTATLFFTVAAPAADVLPDRLKICVSLHRDSERLACFDRAMAEMQSGAQEPPASPEDMFGANSVINAAQGANQPTKREELKEISGVVTSLRHADDGMIIVDLDNGQSWRQQDQEVTLLIAAGDTVTVMRASLGTFRIADKRGRSARFRRVR